MFSLVGETVRFTVSVTSITESDSFTIVTPVTVIESLTLTTVATPLTAEIGGASKLKLGPQETIELDGSGSKDPDEMGSQDLNYQWDCYHVSRKFLFFYSSSHEIFPERFSFYS